MSSRRALPAALDFLNDMLGDRREEYRFAKWRINSFEDYVWLSEVVPQIDFRIRLHDGSLLTDKRHSRLLEVLKTWICVQSHFDTTGGSLINDDTLRQRIRFTLHVIDYFLLNSERFDLATHGLENITENDIVEFLTVLSRSGSVADSIYRWPERLAAFLRTNISSLSDELIAKTLSKHPMLKEDIPPVDERMMALSEPEIILARVWLFLQGYFYDNVSYGYRFGPSTTRLAKDIYANTLGGMHKKEVPKELLLGAAARYGKEYQAVPVKSLIEGQMSEKVFANYVASLRRLGLLAELGLPVPLPALISVSYLDVARSLNLRQLKRFRNLPQELVFSSLRNSIEFGLKYGDDIVTSVLNVMKASLDANLECRAYCIATDIRPLLTKKIRDLGVTSWTVWDAKPDELCIAGGSDCYPYFNLLRSNVGLWELVRVLFGSIQINVGTLSARRQKELSDLVAGMCLDISRTFLVFLNRKSGIAGMRKKEARPVPPIVVRLIGLLERLQKGMIELGLQSEFSPLFAFPNFFTGKPVALDATQYNDSLDYFCDYFQTPINSKGERYYIRQHQLRRFIALLFFWGRSFGGLDTLRWFLGHSDMKHVYHYITESVPGDVLRSIKTIYAVDQIEKNAEDTKMLADLVEQRFGTRNVSVLDSEELTEYVEELIYTGEVEIEPEFLTSADGVDYRILIVVHPKNRPS